jgi:hypothetical protein
MKRIVFVSLVLLSLAGLNAFLQRPTLPHLARKLRGG